MDPAPTLDERARRAEEMAALLSADVLGIAIGERDDVLEANDEFLRVVDLPRERLSTGLTWNDVSPADQGDIDAGAWAQLTETGSALALQQLSRPDGTRVPVLTASAALPGTDRWVSVVLDLSADERLRRLVGSEAAIVSTLLDDAPVGFAFIDPDLRFVRVNRELAQMNGFSVAEHIGVRAFDLLPELRETAEPLLRRVLETGEPLRDAVITGMTPADPGVEHTWLESFFPIRAPHGSVLGVAAIARDDTQVRRLQTELAATADRQRRALEQLQTGLLPALSPVAGVDLAARYLSAAEELRIGGDWYDAVVAPDGRLVLSVGDAVGHGLFAVGLMARASAAVRAFVSEGHPPAVVLHQLNRLLLTPESAGLASAVVVAIDTVTGEVEYAGAGHPYAMISGPGGTATQLVDAQGPLLGTVATSVYPTARARVEPGGAVLLYTDGLVERRDEILTVGLDRLADLLSAQPATPCAATLVDAALEACLAGEPGQDDVCVLAAVRPAADGVAAPR